MASASEGVAYRPLDNLDEVPNGTLKIYIKTNDDDFMGYIGKMPKLDGTHIINILTRTNQHIGTNYYFFTEFLEKLCSKYSNNSPWIMAGLLTDHMIRTPELVKKQILLKKINNRLIAAIINITGSSESKKPGLNDKYKNKIIFFECPIRVIYVYDVIFSGSTIVPVGPPKIGNVITNIINSLSTNFTYVVDPNKVDNFDLIVDWFGEKSIREIDRVITTITVPLTYIQDNHTKQENLPKMDAATGAGGKRRTNNNNYAITPKITRVYRNKRYRSKRHSRVNLKRNLMNDKGFMVMTSSKRRSRKHRRRTSCRK